MALSCILYQNQDQTITVLDIPRSIESAQEVDKEQDGGRSLISARAIEQPYCSPEPKSIKALASVGNPSLRDLVLNRHLQLALAEVKKNFTGSWHSPRVIADQEPVRCCGNAKRKILESLEDIPALPSPGEPSTNISFLESVLNQKEEFLRVATSPGSGEVYQNAEKTTRELEIGAPPSTIYLPPLSTCIDGDIEQTCNNFRFSAPQFDLIIMDPPWPNRSARRKKAYNISYGTSDIASLLSSIPIREHLADNALVGIWVTNKPAFRDILLSENALFQNWGLKLIEEWIWLKVTVSGEPICDLNSTWRKPYEVLLVGKTCPANSNTIDVKRRTIIGVPDLHSRKPNLKMLFEPLLPSKYEALELFARNMTAGWWVWGNEVLKFQHEKHWVPYKVQ